MNAEAGTSPLATHPYMAPSTPAFAYIGEDVSELADQELYSEIMECGMPLLEVCAAMARGYLKGNPVAVLAKMIGTAACDAPGAEIWVGIGSRPAPLNFLFCLMAPSGVGKGTSLDAPMAVADPMGGYRMVTPASGEALVSAFFDTQPAADGKGTEAVRHTEPVWASWNEIDAFAAKSGPTASTLDAHLRSMFTGERVGDTSITRQKSGIGCVLDANSYRLVMYVGAQPDHAGVLLEDATGGTLQRLVWLPIIDEDAPRSLTEAKVHRARLAALMGIPVSETDKRSPTVTVWGPRFGHVVHPDVEEMMFDRRSGVLSGEVEVDPLSTHADNLKLRLALIFASWRAGIGNPAVVDMEAWWWASCVVELSDRTRTECIDCAQSAKKEDADKAGRLDAIRQLSRDAEIAEEDVRRGDRLTERIRDKVRESGTVTHRALYSAVTNRYNRKHFTEALNLCLAASDIERFTVGNVVHYKHIDT